MAQTKELKVNQKENYYGTGRRKSAIARVWIMPGKGNIEINGKPMAAYLNRDALEIEVLKPFVATATVKGYDVKAMVKGGGIAGQADAVRHGIARALLLVNPDFRKSLKQEGLITRDPREKEAKKYGRKRARKGFQYRKR